MGKQDDIGPCLKIVTRPQFLFGLRIFTSVILVVGIVLQSMAVSGKTKWDMYETTLEPNAYLYLNVTEISAYQTLYDLFVLKDILYKDRPVIPPVYPFDQNELNVGWKDKIVTYETASQGLGFITLFIFENACLMQCLNPDSRWSRLYQPLALFTSMSLTSAAGVLSIIGATYYGENFQSVLYISSGPAHVATQYKILRKYGFSYKFQDNVLSTGYYMAMSAGGLLCLTGILSLANLVLYVIWRHNESKLSKVENIEGKLDN